MITICICIRHTLYYIDACLLGIILAKNTHYIDLFSRFDSSNLIANILHMQFGTTQKQLVTTLIDRTKNTNNITLITFLNPFFITNFTVSICSCAQFNYSIFLYIQNDCVLCEQMRPLGFMPL